nr:hypothetical protein [Alphaproteobacteria bacterium]
MTSNTMRLRSIYCAFFLVGLVGGWLAAPNAAEAQAGKFFVGASAESTVSRLSDAEVRELLLQRLQGAGAGKATEPESFNPAVFAYRLQRNVGTLAEELHAIFGSVTELPAIFPQAWAQFSADREAGGLAWFVVALAVSMGAAGVIEFIVWRKVGATPLFTSGAAPTGLRNKASRLGLMFLVRAALLVLFLAVSTVIFLLFFDGDGKDRIAFFFYLTATGIFRLAYGLSHAFCAPDYPTLRLPSFSDGDALSLHRTALITVGFGAFAYFTCALFGTLGIVGEVHELFLILVGTATTLLLMYAILAGRRALSADIAGASTKGESRAVFADFWPWIYAVLVLTIWIYLVVTELLFDFVPYGAALFTIAALAALPSMDALLQRETRRQQDAGEMIAGAIARGGRLLLMVLAVVSFSAAWRINPFAVTGIGGQAAGAALQITLTLLVAYVVWQAVRIYIDRKIADEDAEMAALGIEPGEMEMGGTGMSR